MNLEGLPGPPSPYSEGANRHAAVLIPVISPTEAARLLFTKRADWLSRHPGQMSFPGGVRDPTDRSPVGTACREAHEEVGLAPEEVSIIGGLQPIQTVSGFTVTPVVARVPDRTFVPDGREIVETVVIHVSELTDPANYDQERTDSPDAQRDRVEYFYVDDYTIWGATGRLLAQLFERTTDWERPVITP